MFHAAPPMASLFRANAAAMTSGLRSATFRIWWREKKGEADDHLRFGGVAVRAQAARLSGREGDRIRVEGGRHSSEEGLVGKECVICVDLGGRRILTKKNKFITKR